MRTMVRFRTAKWLAWSLASTVLVPYMASGALAASQVSDVKPQTMVLFPLDKAATVTKLQVVSELNAFLGQGLASCPRYSVLEYTERLPAVERLAAMQSEMKLIAVGPFSPDDAGIAHAAVLARAISADLFLVGSVEKYTFADREGVAEITATVRLVDTKTGKAVQTITVTGRGTKPSPTAPAGESSIASEAVRDTGRKVIQEVTGEEYKERAVPPPIVAVRKKSSKKSWIPLLLLSLGVGLLLGGSGGGGDGGGGGADPVPDQPPPIPF
ncbi:MAG TPA: hypothetical protein VMX94_00440 [Armatimonadota bacterium]|nr:hypothetical protein [Armatimonadota bacterium]